MTLWQFTEVNRIHYDTVIIDGFLHYYHIINIYPLSSLGEGTVIPMVYL